MDQVINKSVSNVIFNVSTRKIINKYVIHSLIHKYLRQNK